MCCKARITILHMEPFFVGPIEDYVKVPTFQTTYDLDLEHKKGHIAPPFDVFCKGKSYDIWQSPISVEFYNRKIPDSTNERSSAISVEGALERCKAHEKRIARLNRMIAFFEENSSVYTDNYQTMTRSLSHSKYFPVLNSQMLSLRLMNRHNSLHQFDDITSHSDCAANLHQNLKLGSEISDEIGSLQLLQQLAQKAVRAMLLSMSGDIPISREEVKDALSHVKGQTEAQESIERTNWGGDIETNMGDGSS